MLPLDSLLHRLESAGFRVSPADRLRVMQLLDTMGSECLDNPEKLRLLLAPILARSAAEQAKFYEVFDQWMPRSIVGVTPSHPDNKRRRWFIAGGLVILALFTAWYFTRPEPTSTLPKEGITQNSPQDSTNTSENPTELPQEKPAEQEILKPQLPIKELLLAKEQETPRPSWLAWFILALLTLSAGWMWWKWAKRAAPKPPESKRSAATTPGGVGLGEFADAPPYTIPFRGQEAYIRTGREQYRLADAMRQRQQGEHPYMDVPASVQATLDKGGFPTLRFRLRRQPADYLCVIDEKHRQSHLTRLFKFFAEHIRGQDVALEIFQASNTLDRFWNAQYPGGLTLDQLQRLFPAHRLLLFGDAHALLDVAASGQARIRPDMSAAFRRWRQRVLFTPNAPATWTFEEKALYDLFALFPATLQGMNDAAHHIEASVGVSADDEAPASFARWRERAQQRVLPAIARSAKAGGVIAVKQHDHRYTRWRDAADHEEYLAGRPDLLRWLRALAVYPTPTWEITLAIGQSLEKQGVTVRPDDLLILSRIGWLQTGRMPSAVREEFMADLPREAEMAARHAVITALEEARTEAGNGFAGIELGVNVAIQEFALAPNDPEKQEVMRLLFEEGRVNKVQEIVADGALAKISKVSQTSEISASVSAREFVKKEAEEKSEAELPKRPFFTGQFWIAVILTLVAIEFVGLIYLLWFSTSWFSQEKDKRDWAQQNLFEWQVQADSATVWNNRGVRVWNERRDTAEAMRLLNKAYLADSTGVLDQVIRDTTFSYSSNILAAVNHQTLRYNIVAEALNALFEKAPLPPSDLRFYPKAPRDQHSFDVFGPNFDRNIIPNCGIWLVGTEYNPLMVDLEKSRIPSLQKDAIHAKGLMLLYSLSREGAEKSYDRLIALDSAYFINLRSPRPNLETLLGNFSNRIVSVEVSSDAKGRLRGAVYYQLKDQPIQPPVLNAELFDKKGKVLARCSTPQSKAAKGQNQAIFLLPVDLKTADFVSDSIRILLMSPGKEATTLGEWKEARRFVWRGEWVPLQVFNQDSISLLGEWEVDIKDSINIDHWRIKIEADRIQYCCDENVLPAKWYIRNGRFFESRQMPKRDKSLTIQESSGLVNWISYREFTIFFDKSDDAYIKGETLRYRRFPVPEEEGKGPTEVHSVKAPALDSDADGIPDTQDKCPNEKGDQANAGCPPSALDPARAATLAQIASNMLPVPGGTFTMGSKDKEAEKDECPHQVTVSSFQMSKYEVTQAQWRAVMDGDPPELYNKGCDDCPVEGVSWDDAQEFLKKLNEQTGQHYRLPSEAEWEYAAKGGQAGIKYSYKYAGSDNLDEVAWYGDNYKDRNTFGEKKTTHPVGGKKANQLGIYDMSGNVWEWCQDIYGPYPCDKKTKKNEGNAVLRGGSWYSPALRVRSAIRGRVTTTDRFDYNGFRCARDGTAGKQ